MLWAATATFAGLPESAPLPSATSRDPTESGAMAVMKVDATGVAEEGCKSLTRALQDSAGLSPKLLRERCHRKVSGGVLSSAAASPIPLATALRPDSNAIPWAARAGWKSCRRPGASPNSAHHCRQSS